jgi:hypothetical protein
MDGVSTAYSGTGRRSALCLSARFANTELCTSEKSTGIPNQAFEDWFEGTALGGSDVPGRTRCLAWGRILDVADHFGVLGGAPDAL